MAVWPRSAGGRRDDPRLTTARGRGRPVEARDVLVEELDESPVRPRRGPAGDGVPRPGRARRRPRGGRVARARRRRGVARAVRPSRGREALPRSEDVRFSAARRRISTTSSSPASSRPRSSAARTAHAQLGRSTWRRLSRSRGLSPVVRGADLGEGARPLPVGGVEGESSPTPATRCSRASVFGTRARRSRGGRRSRAVAEDAAELVEVATGRSSGLDPRTAAEARSSRRRGRNRWSAGIAHTATSRVRSPQRNGSFRSRSIPRLVPRDRDPGCDREPRGRRAHGLVLRAGSHRPLAQRGRARARADRLPSS